ncbi:hypothetical protein ARMGADRAFT_1084355 [Armillaria gallica]|uniref:Uncharacterized protein n=1 Tax=Armillaria gallica TaxID=47427 RepID=A0A2H3D3X6_ARMGA|nr:hypothetical protein ARMGADRAFT_1084355 [Armillaria gallica]
MPLLTLRVIRPASTLTASTLATRCNYIEVNSDDEPHPTDIFATSSDDEPVAAIIANALLDTEEEEAELPRKLEEVAPMAVLGPEEAKCWQEHQVLAAPTMLPLPRKLLEDTNFAPKYRLPQSIQTLG